MIRLILSATFLLAAISAHAKVITEKVEYKDGDTVMEGFLARDDKFKGARPGVLIVHDWMGLSDNTEMRAKQMAELGYVAFAADIYGKGVRPKNGDDAGKLAGKYKADRKLLRSRVNAALETLKKQKQVNAAKLGAMGYCFGGTTVLELARSGADVKGVVTFHGGLDSPTPADGKNIKGKLLILHGALDPFVSQKDIEAFKKELNDAKIDYQFTLYSGAVHSFTIKEAGNDITKGAAYNAEADKHSFREMKDFFSEVL